MATVEELFKSYTGCINEERWQDLPNFVSFPLDLNGEDIPTPEAIADKIKTTGRLRLDTDAITVDEETRRLGANSLVTLQIVKDGRDKTVEFTQQSIIWAANGKISKIATLSDHDALQRQLSEPNYVAAPDLIRTHQQHAHEDDDATTRLSKRELEATYRAYIRCINAQTMEADLPTFCHAHVVHNATRHPLREYRRLMEDAFDAVPDIVFGADAVVADEAAQRVAVRIELAGTPTGRLAGAEPTGRGGEF